MNGDTKVTDELAHTRRIHITFVLAKLAKRPL